MSTKRSPTLTALAFGGICLLLAAVCALTVMLAQFFARSPFAADVIADAEKSPPMIIIDPGHGGMDGGAVGVDGTLEKEINLSVAKKLAALLRYSGYECVLTREDDRMLVDEDVKTHRKMHDLKNRVALAGEYDEPVFVSIHMNNFSKSAYSGLQVWYSKNTPESEQLATYIQTYAHTFLDPFNNRSIKAATSAIYVLDRIQTPAVLVECGFLSNPEECAKLSGEDYQNQLAVTIWSALVSWLNNQ
ncbi:MAG: N-acetylmuramoyl-L-alanine amidase [Clostridia bacterium]|nr:N-acetylmuramoyl-L-alanine amidase [Clostridia bacterium]